MRHGELGHAKDIVQALYLPRVKLLKTGTAAGSRSAKATATTTASATVTATAAAVEAATPTTATAVATAEATAATAAHAEDLGGDVHEWAGADEGRVGSVELAVGCGALGQYEKTVVAHLHGGKAGLGPTE